MCSKLSWQAMAPSLALASAWVRDIPPMKNWAKVAATSNSLAALAIALEELRADCKMPGKTGHSSSTSGLRTTHSHPLWIKSQDGSDLDASTCSSFGPWQPCCKALRKAVVWLQLKDKKPEAAQGAFAKSSKKKVYKLSQLSLVKKIAWVAQKHSWPVTGAKDPLAAATIWTFLSICFCLVALLVESSAQMLPPTGTSSCPPGAFASLYANNHGHSAWFSRGFQDG